MDKQFANKRAEIYWLGAQWIKREGQLPPEHVPGMAELAAAMTTTTYSAKGDKLLMEPKLLIKDRLGYSPDDADAFCLTFSSPIAGKDRRQARGTHQSDWSLEQAFAELSGQNTPRGHRAEYDPYA